MLRTPQGLRQGPPGFNALERIRPARPEQGGQDRGGAGRAAPGPRGRYWPPPASVIFTILSGFCTAPLSAFEPFLILSTTSMPEVTTPTTV